ncbi:MAG: acyl-CoA dehydrogenase [Acidimicrobiia bacterium]
MDTRPPNLDTTLTDERVRPFLPLVYLAWSDAELSPDELEGICTEIARHNGIDIDCQVALRRWLDPERPPTPTEFGNLAAQVVAWAADVDLPSSATVTDLGVAIAEVTRSNGEVTSDERQALDDIADRYGPFGPISGALGGEISLRDVEIPETPFAVDLLTDILDGVHGPTRRRMRALLSQPDFAYQCGVDTHTYREQVLDWAKTIAAGGFGSLGYPEPYGQDDVGAFVAAFTTLAHHDLSLLTKVGVQFGLFGGSIARLGTADHHEEYLDDAGSLVLPGCFAMTETGHGSNVRDLETTARFDPRTDELIITTPNDLARKDYIGNAAAHGRLAVVFARLIVDNSDHGVHAVLVPIRSRTGVVSNGVRIEDNGEKGGLNGVDNGRIWFSDVRVPRANLLNRFGSINSDGVYTSDIPSPDRRFFTMIGTLVGGRVSVGSASVSVAKSALTIAIRYAHRRRQFGPAPAAESLLIDYPIHQQRLIPRLAATYAYHFAFEELIAQYAQDGGDRRDLEATAAGLKAFASWHALDTIQAAREATGGQGYLAINRLTTMHSDADVFTTYEGDNTILTQLVAKALLTEFRQQFESMGMSGMVRYIFRRATSAAAESSPITVSPTERDRLLDPSWQKEQLRWRRDHLVEALAKRMKIRIDNGADPFDAFTAVQNHARSAAESHVDWLVLESFIRGIANVDDAPVAASLGRLRALHALATIRKNLGWYQEHNHLTSATARSIRKLHDQLVGEVAPESLALVDAFAIPDQILAAPIASAGTHA